MAILDHADYEALIYSLAENYPEQIRRSTLRLYTTSALTARVEGEVHFTNGLVLKIREFLDFRIRKIIDYSYTIFRGDEKIRWYDPQPHPQNQDLAETFPHHYHEEPDTKHNRKPAPGIAFEAPNLPGLIADCITLGEMLAQ
ncbi:MAG: hypothetical protein ISS57_02535 [Anaerolineales bacterium]|nr:hypothetical protein [Chloroflexota bacterium]MBL7161455.1 hypothetical protein [Anaerolineales bacterium]